VPFVYLAPCGCVFSRAGLAAVASPSKSKSDVAEVKEAREKDDEKHLCPQCGAKFAQADVRTINPAPEEEERLRLALAAAAASKPVKAKKRKADKDADAPADASSKKTKTDADAPPAKKDAPAPTIAGASRALAAGLAMEEAKRKTGMSAAVQSLYAKDGGRTQTWATMGTFTRVSASPFCRECVGGADTSDSMRERGCVVVRARGCFVTNACSPRVCCKTRCTGDARPPWCDEMMSVRAVRTLSSQHRAVARVLLHACSQMHVHRSVVV
jgi:hypothetical protein